MMSRRTEAMNLRIGDGLAMKLQSSPEHALGGGQLSGKL